MRECIQLVQMGMLSFAQAVFEFSVLHADPLGPSPWVRLRSMISLSRCCGCRLWLGEKQVWRCPREPGSDDPCLTPCLGCSSSGSPPTTHGSAASVNLRRREPYCGTLSRERPRGWFTKMIEPIDACFSWDWLGAMRAPTFTGDSFRGASCKIMHHASWYDFLGLSVARNSPTEANPFGTCANVVRGYWQ